MGSCCTMPQKSYKGEENPIKSNDSVISKKIYNNEGIARF